MNAKEVGQTIMKMQNKQKNRDKNNGDPWNKKIVGNSQNWCLKWNQEIAGIKKFETWNTRNVLIRFLLKKTPSFGKLNDWNYYDLS